MTDVLVDGRPGDRIPVDDRGLLYGDLLFETVAFIDGRAPLWRWHMDRLERDAPRLGLKAPAADVLLDECRRLLPEVGRGIVRVSLTRGSGGRAYEPLEPPRCRRILQRRDWPGHVDAQRRDGLAVVTSPIRLGCDSPLAGMKHGNRLEQVLAARACRRAGADEALLFDARGRLIEAIASNVIVVHGDAATTPRLDSAGVAGVGLAWLMSQAETAISEAELTDREVVRADEVVMINSVTGIRPVTSLDGRTLPAGPACRGWQHLWSERVECVN